MRASEAQNGKTGAALVLGGGIGGMQAALDLAASGIKVYLVDNKPSIGGKMSQLDKTFPTNDCAMCTMAPRLVEISGNKDIDKLTLCEVAGLEGEAGNFEVTLKKKPRYVNELKCTGCGACVANCPASNVLQLVDREDVELEPEFKEKVIEIIQRHKARDGPLMPILQDINSAFNYFPEGVLTYVAQETGYPVTHLFRIATFYSAFSVTPRGKNMINVCMGTACYVSGGGRIMERFSDDLGIGPDQTTPDMEFTLKTVRCIGCCGLAPAMMIGDEVFGKMATSRVRKILDHYREVRHGQTRR
jgi:NADH:ubiquinone oxidoreductase subunit E